jgi:hypothetical protein
MQMDQVESSNTPRGYIEPESKWLHMWVDMEIWADIGASVTRALKHARLRVGNSIKQNVLRQKHAW